MPLKKCYHYHVLGQGYPIRSRLFVSWYDVYRIFFTAGKLHNWKAAKKFIGLSFYNWLNTRKTEFKSKLASWYRCSSTQKKILKEPLILSKCGILVPPAPVLAQKWPSTECLRIRKTQGSKYKPNGYRRESMKRNADHYLWPEGRVARSWVKIT